MSPPTTMVEALEWALRKLGDGGDYFDAADRLLQEAKGSEQAPQPGADTLSRHQRSVIEEVATICNTMRGLAAVGSACAPTVDPADLLYASEMDFCRAGALADSLIDGDVVGSIADWMEVQP